MGAGRVHPHGAECGRREWATQCMQPGAGAEEGPRGAEVLCWPESLSPFCARKRSTVWMDPSSFTPHPWVLGTSELRR